MEALNAIVCRKTTLHKNKGEQEIIKVRERIHGIGLIPKVIRLKLFLDMVTSSSEDVTAAMRRQPTRLSRNYQRNFAKSHFICFNFQKTLHSR